MSVVDKYGERIELARPPEIWEFQAVSEWAMGNRKREIARISWIMKRAGDSYKRIALWQGSTPRTVKERIRSVIDFLHNSEYR